MTQYISAIKKDNKIDEIPNEQPHEIKEYENYFEFDIIGVEKRILKKITTGNTVVPLFAKT